jgi:guanylate kinase
MKDRTRTNSERDAIGSGHLFVVSAPSGAGKTTLCQAVRKQFPELRYSVSYTTRKPRTGEMDGRDYHFIDKRSFEKGVADHQWAEWAVVHGHYYGTSADFIDKELGAGHDILLDIDVQGAAQILERYPEAVTIFIEPPALETLRKRLESRNTDTPAEIERRLRVAENEMAQKNRYRHIIINDELVQAIQSLARIIVRYQTKGENR